MASEDDEKLFLEEMAGVTPAPKAARADLKSNKVVTPGELERRQAATAERAKDGNNLSTEYIEMFDPFAVLTFRRDGVQNGVFRKLKQGRYSFDACLDLHKKGVDQARKEVYEFIKEACKYDLRTVMILHGKGDRNKEQPALLKSFTAKWLTEIPEVLAYHSAQQRQGGVGAVYILLRKSNKLKGENRERFGARS